MAVKMLVGIAGADFSYSPGEEVSFDSETEKRLIESGQAEKLNQKKPSAKKASKNPKK